MRTLTVSETSNVGGGGFLCDISIASLKLAGLVVAGAVIVGGILLFNCMNSQTLTPSTPEPTSAP